jgi:hypothetical protein
MHEIDVGIDPVSESERVVADVERACAQEQLTRTMRDTLRATLSR